MAARQKASGCETAPVPDISFDDGKRATRSVLRPGPDECSRRHYESHRTSKTVEQGPNLKERRYISDEPSITLIIPPWRSTKPRASQNEPRLRRRSQTLDRSAVRRKTECGCRRASPTCRTRPLSAIGSCHGGQARPGFDAGQSLCPTTALPSWASSCFTMLRLETPLLHRSLLRLEAPWPTRSSHVRSARAARMPWCRWWSARQPNHAWTTVDARDVISSG